MKLLVLWKINKQNFGGWSMQQSRILHHEGIYYFCPYSKSPQLLRVHIIILVVIYNNWSSVVQLAHHMANARCSTDRWWSTGILYCMFNSLLALLIVLQRNFINGILLRNFSIMRTLRTIMTYGCSYSIMVGTFYKRFLSQFIYIIYKD